MICEAELIEMEWRAQPLSEAEFLYPDSDEVTEAIHAHRKHAYRLRTDVERLVAEVRRLRDGRK